MATRCSLPLPPWEGGWCGGAGGANSKQKALCCGVQYILQRNWKHHFPRRCEYWTLHGPGSLVSDPHHLQQGHMALCGLGRFVSHRCAGNCCLQPCTGSGAAEATCKEKMQNCQGAQAAAGMSSSPPGSITQVPRTGRLLWKRLSAGRELQFAFEFWNRRSSLALRAQKAATSPWDSEQALARRAVLGGCSRPAPKQ